MQIVTPKQMVRLEERSEKLGVSKRQLMENAGRKLAELIDGYCRNEAKLSPEECSVVFLAGTGNNGGDCFAAADILLYKVRVITSICLLLSASQSHADVTGSVQDPCKIFDGT